MHTSTYQNVNWNIAKWDFGQVAALLCEVIGGARTLGKAIFRGLDSVLVTLRELLY